MLVFVGGSGGVVVWGSVLLKQAHMAHLKGWRWWWCWQGVGYERTRQGGGVSHRRIRAYTACVEGEVMLAKSLHHRIWAYTVTACVEKVVVLAKSLLRRIQAHTALARRWWCSASNTSLHGSCRCRGDGGVLHCWIRVHMAGSGVGKELNMSAHSSWGGAYMLGVLLVGLSALQAVRKNK